MFPFRRPVASLPPRMIACLLWLLAGLVSPAMGVDASWPDAPRAGKPAGTSSTGSSAPSTTLPPETTTPALGAGARGTTGKSTGAVKTADDAERGDAGTAATAEGAADAAGPSPANADAPPAPPRNPPLRMETRRNRDLARELERQGGRSGKPLWVGEGEEPFLAVLTPQEGLKVKGGLILLHDQAQHPDWPGILHALRTRMPSSGWMTLSVAVPDFVASRRPVPSTPPASDTPDTPEQSTEPSSEDTGEAADTGGDTPEPASPRKRVVVPAGDNGSFLQRQVEYGPDEYQQEVRSRIDRAIKKLRDEDDIPVALAAFGQTAGLVSGLLAMEPDERLEALVMVEPEEFPDQGFKLAKDVARLDIPVLDIVNDELDEGEARWRKLEANRNQQSRYEQRRILSADREFEGFEAMVGKSVSGWLSRQLPGMPAPAPEKAGAAMPGATAIATGAPTGMPPTGTPSAVDAAATTPQQTPADANATAAPPSTAPVAAAANASPVPPPPVPGRPRLVTPNLQEPVPVPPPVPPPTP